MGIPIKKTMELIIKEVEQLQIIENSRKELYLIYIDSKKFISETIGISLFLSARRSVMAGALTFRDGYMGIYQEVYPEPGKYYPKLKKELNEFLNKWLKNMIEVHKYQLTA